MKTTDPKTRRLRGLALALLTAAFLAGCAGKQLMPMDHSLPTRPADEVGDLPAHEWAQLEWWYYTGHLFTESGENYAFELTFFRRRIENDIVHGLPLRWFGQTALMAHFALVNLETAEYWRAADFLVSWGDADLPTDRYEVKLKKWSAVAHGKVHHLEAERGDMAISLDLTPLKPLARHGAQGIVRKDEKASSYYISYTRMKAEGTIRFKGEEFRVTGQAWWDHEWGNMGTVTSAGWDWFSIQLENNTEYMIYAIHAPEGGYTPYSLACRIDEAGGEECRSLEGVTLEPRAWWRSPHSGVVYPVAWRVAVPVWDLDVLVVAIIPNQEFYFVNLFYWEGACRVSGSPAAGRAFVELSARRKNWIYSLKNGE